MEQNNSLSREIGKINFGSVTEPPKKSSTSYQKKDPSHGLGYFYRRKYVRKTPNENGKYVMYYWYYISHHGGKRDHKEYLGNSDDENCLPVKCPPRFRILFAQIQAARAYKARHSTQ